MGDSGSGGRSLDALLGELARSPDVVPASSLVGKTIGRYRVDALLGRGGMGVVYRAFDGKLARDVALKVLPPELLGDAERRARFLREARLAAAVTHPCTAAVYDVGEDGDAAFVAMELIRGKTLRSALEPGPFDVARAVRITRDIARGLSKAHESGIVHRDLKPENVMLDEEDQVKVLDFGLAKLREAEGDGGASTSTEAGRILGTPSYMSPEQLRSSKDVDGRADIWSLGVILYELIAGVQPFLGTSLTQITIRVVQEEPTALQQLRPDVPPALADAIHRCLAKQRDQRFGSVAELAHALEPFAIASMMPGAAARGLPSSSSPSPARSASAARSSAGPSV
jgi:serine/threonine-protein kinase